MDFVFFTVGALGAIVCLVWMIVNIIRHKDYKRQAICVIIGVAMVFAGMLMPSSGKDEADKKTEAKQAEITETIKPDKALEKSKEQKSAEPEELPFKKECEENAEKHPAKAGAMLYTKGKHNFTGTKYYFKGEIIKLSIVDGDEIWLAKNDNGYVMPVDYDRFKAGIGDTVEVWGTLSGDGYTIDDDVDNVVGQTGFIHAMMAAVNGEEQ